MSKSERQKRICPNRHTYYKTSDCPVCPICETKRKPATSFMEALSAPARRALENAGIITLSKLSKKTEKEILALHGMGPGSIPVLKKALKVKGLKFKGH